MSIDPPKADRIKELFLFYLLKRAERSDIHNSSIVNRQSSFHEVSYEVSGVSAAAGLKSDQFNRKRNFGNVVSYKVSGVRCLESVMQKLKPED